LPCTIPFLSDSFNIRKKGEIRDILAACVRQKAERQADTPPEPVNDPVRKRKREYQKLQSDGFELVVTTPGAFVGRTLKGITVKVKGRLYIRHHLTT